MDQARSQGRSALPELMVLWLEAARATLFSRNGHPTDIPDWPVRLRAIEQIANRCGLAEQKEIKVEMTDGEKADAWLAALEAERGRGDDATAPH